MSALKSNPTSSKIFSTAHETFRPHPRSPFNTFYPRIDDPSFDTWTVAKGLIPVPPPERIRPLAVKMAVGSIGFS
jgi:hypothetical protein